MYTSYPKADPVRRSVRLRSPAPALVNRGYHKVWEWVKRNAPTATSWGRGKIYVIAEKTICKVAYQFRRSLVNNDKATISPRHDAIEPLLFRSPLSASARCTSGRSRDRPRRFSESPRPSSPDTFSLIQQPRGCTV